MITNFQKIESASTIVLSTPLLTAAAAACDTLEMAGIPAVLGFQKGCPVVAVTAEHAGESRQLLWAAWGRVAL